MPLTVHHEWRGNLVFPAFNRRAREALRQIAPQIEEHAVSLCPVDTGALRSTVSAIVMDTGIRLVIEAGGPAPDFSTYVAYAAIIHDGSDRIVARPFITWTLNAWESQIRSAVASAWNPFAR